MLNEIEISTNMKTTIRLTLAAFSFMLTAPAFAQQFSSSYFMEGSMYRHELNPAFQAPQNYVAMPLLGNLNIGLKGNLGIGDVFFNRNGKTVTYLHPDVTPADALKNINDKNKFILDVRTPILAGGFAAWKGYNTVGINLRVMGGVHFGKELFDLTKNLQNQNYNIGNAAIMSQAFVEVAFGHSHKIDDNWTVGGKLKFLFGAARLNAELQNLQMNLESPNEWRATAKARVEGNVTGLELLSKHAKYNDETKNTKVDPATGERYGYDTIDDVKLDKPGLGGFGLALDLGAVYDFKDLVPGLKASLSFIDLGFIHWDETHVIENNGEEFVFDGFQNIRVKDGNENNKTLSNQIDDLGDRLQDLYRLENKGNTGGSTHGIGLTMNVGVEYTLQAYDKIRFGLLSTTRFHGDYTWNEERLSVNYAPCNWFDMNINGGIGTFGPCLGWMLNVHPVGFNFFIGMDHTFFKAAKPYIPMNKNADFTIGINFPFSKPKKASNS